MYLMASAGTVALSHASTVYLVGRALSLPLISYNNCGSLTTAGGKRTRALAERRIEHP